MSLRDRVNRIAERVRAIPSHPRFDERTTRVTIRTRTWAGRVGSEGGFTDVDLEISPRPRVRELNQREIAGSGGRYLSGDLRIGPITPSYAGGGYTQEQLAPVSETNGVEIIYLLEGQQDGEHARVQLETDRNHAWFIVVRRERSTP